MRLVPVLLLLCLMCSASSAKKLKKIKNLIVTVGSIASIARGGRGGIGKSLQLISQRFAASGQQYASNYANQPLVISTIVSSLNTTTNTLHPITSTNPVTVNTVQPLVSNYAATINTLQPPASSPIAISSVQPLASAPVVNTHQPQLLPTSGLVSQHTVNTAFPIAAPYALPVPNFFYGAVENPATIPIAQPTPIASNGLLDLAQHPLLVDPLLHSGWVG